MFCHDIKHDLRDQGAACQVRRNNAKVFKNRQKIPGVPVSGVTKPFPNGATKIMPVPDKAQKIFCVIVSRLFTVLYFPIRSSRYFSFFFPEYTVHVNDSI